MLHIFLLLKEYLYSIEFDLIGKILIYTNIDKPEQLSSLEFLPLILLSVVNVGREPD